MAADLAAVEGLPHAEAGQGGRIRDVGLLQLDQAGESLQGIADDLLHGLGFRLRLQVPESDLGVSDDLRQHGEECLVPTAAGSWSGGRTNHEVTFQLRPPRMAGGGPGVREVKTHTVFMEVVLKEPWKRLVEH